MSIRILPHRCDISCGIIPGDCPVAWADHPSFAMPPHQGEQPDITDIETKIRQVLADDLPEALAALGLPMKGVGQ